MKTALLVFLLSGAALIARAGDRTITLSGKIGGGTYSLTAVIGAVPPITGASPDNWGTWGEAGDKASRTSRGFKSFRLLVKGHEVFIPRKALWDLRDAREITVTVPDKGGKRLQVHVSGADAGAAYSAVFTIDNGFLQERLVRSGEFPDECWERTTYSWTDEKLPNM